MTELELERLLRRHAAALTARPLSTQLRERMLAPAREWATRTPLARPIVPALLVAQVVCAVAVTLAVLAMHVATAGAPAPVRDASQPAGSGTVQATATSPFDRVVLEGRREVNDAWLAQISACRRLDGAALPPNASACRSTAATLRAAAGDFAVRLRSVPPPPGLAAGASQLDGSLGELQTWCTRLIDAIDGRDAPGFAVANDWVGYVPQSVNQALTGG